MRDEVPVNASEALGAYPPLLRKLLFARGIRERAAAEVYLHPDWARDSHDPLLARDMDKALGRIERAVKSEEKILIFGDYDADGIPGAALLYSLFGRIGHRNLEVYIPDRYSERYGLAEESIYKFAEAGVKVMITVDCGITDTVEAQLAQSLGIDLIITDHHLPHDVLPAAYAVINHKRADDTYPFKYLSGGGTALKLAQAILRRLSLPQKYEEELLELATISTVCDMMPMVGENRSLVQAGLQALAKSSREGIRALCRQGGISQALISEDDLAFVLGPRINISSRMSRGIDAFQLLTTNDAMLANTLTRQLEDRNAERRKTVDVIMDSVTSSIEGDGLPDLIAFGSPNWRIGVLGLTANRLMEKYSRSVCLWTEHAGGYAKGSCRSLGDVSVPELFEEMGGKDFFDDYGGHLNAGGFTLTLDRAAQLQERFQTAYGKMARQKSARNQIAVDAKLTPEGMTWALYTLVRRLAPFGKENPNPVFVFENVKIENVKEFGRDKSHVEFEIKSQAGTSLPVMALFTTPQDLGSFVSDSSVDILGSIEAGFGFASPELRLRLVDIRKHE